LNRHRVYDLRAKASRFLRKAVSTLRLNASNGISFGLVMPATRNQPLFLGTLKRARRIGARR
jgi:hypothetical protein